MSRISGLCAVIFFILIFVNISKASAQDFIEITADAAILIDARTGQVIYDKDIHEKRPPASTTKIMTAIIAVEGGGMEQVVIVSPYAASVGESSLNLETNEKLTLEDLLYGALLRSGNDACVAIAEHIAGNEYLFLTLMNHRAKILGALNTHFSNTNGLPAEDHYSSAYDLSMIARYAMQNSKIREIVGTKYKLIDGEDQKSRYLKNTNKLLWDYNGCSGIKTGTTDAAGHCLVASASRDGRKLISVVLHSEDRYGDTTKLLDYGFNNFEEIIILTEGEHFTTAKVSAGYAKNVPIVPNDDLIILVPKGNVGAFEQRITLERNLSAPVRVGDKVGSLSVRINGQEVGNVELVTGSEVIELPKHILLYQKFINQL